MYERRNGREDAEGMDEMMMMRQMETTVTEVGTASTSLQEREGVRERDRDRDRGYELKQESVRQNSKSAL